MLQKCGILELHKQRILNRRWPAKFVDITHKNYHIYILRKNTGI